MPPELKINLHPVNFIIISGILQSIVVAGILFFQNTGNRLANRIIGFFVLVCSLHFSWPLIIDTNLADLFRPVLWFPYSYLLAIGPLIFFYTRSLTEFDFRLTKRELVHFIPLSAEVLLQVMLIWKSVSTETLFYDGTGFLIFRIAEFTGTAMSIFIYGRKSLRLIQAHERWVTENFSNRKDVTLAWLHTLIQYLRILWICWLAFELAFIIFLRFQLHLIPVYLLLYILMIVITYSNYWIGLRSLIKSEVITEKKRAFSPLPNTTVYSRLSDGDLKAHAETIAALMEKEKLYLHETLSLRTLAERLRADPNLVSYILNNVIEKSFYDYVNEFRIEEVKRKMADPKYAHLKMIEIAYDCGFNSKATFNRVFKKVTGQAPSGYKKKPS